ncbi:PepSY-associated TM helix domain-containing protein [Marinobacter sp. M5B]|uniref:PepSY-associated TM helix domain-containing protein n=1 Tax=Marinobacter sp. M5B TaxID=3141535 RepID=UPI0036D3A845
MMKSPLEQDIGGGITPAAQKPAELYQVASRWHLYTGLVVGPFLMVLALTGLIMMLSALTSGVNGELIPVKSEAGKAPVSLSVQEKTARQILPHGSVIEVLVGQEQLNANVFAIEQPGVGTMMVAVNPFSPEVIRAWWQGDRLYDIAKSIHSTLMLGTVGDIVLEVVAGFGVLLLISGCYLWWPHGGGLYASFVPNFKRRGRGFWRELHQVIGVYSAAFILLFLLSGMSWTGIWGGKFVQAWNTFPAEKWGMTFVNDDHHSSSDTERLSPVPWTLEQSPVPKSLSHHHRETVKASTALNIEGVNKVGIETGFGGRYRIKYPQSAEGVWTISQDTMNGDAKNPFSDRTVHIDQYSGDLLADIQFSQYPLGGKVMAVSIPLHMGLMGHANIALNLLVCIAVLSLPAVGIYLWWKRTTRHPETQLATNVLDTNKKLQSGKVVLWCVGVAFPMVGLSLIILWITDYFVVQKLKNAREKRLREIA